MRGEEKDAVRKEDEEKKWVHVGISQGESNSGHLSRWLVSFFWFTRGVIRRGGAARSGVLAGKTPGIRLLNQPGIMAVTY